MQKHFKSDSTAAEIVLASLFMSLKVIEKKSGVNSPIKMSKELFDSILKDTYQTS